MLMFSIIISPRLRYFRFHCIIFFFDSLYLPGEDMQVQILCLLRSPTPAFHGTADADTTVSRHGAAAK